MTSPADWSHTLRGTLRGFRIFPMNLAEHPNVRALMELATREDLGCGDLTSTLMPNPSRSATFALIAKQAGTFAGRDIAPTILHAFDPAIEILWTDFCSDGRAIDRVPAELAELCGPLSSILAAERTLLNFLQRLCGVATCTRAFVDAVAGTGAKIYDTRKTIPGWRVLDRYAVRCGGGCNHRDGLHDAVLVKDNHLVGVPRERLAHAVFEMLNRLASSGAKPSFVEVEADSLEQFEELLKVVGIDVILLDNFTVDELRAAVELREDGGLAGKVALEASGGVTLETVRVIAETGVERISIGSLTHSAGAIDLSLERREC
ncbi:MAG: carboxylating nicotinate-nucleotide diphosphorylase [Planctomycetota bacterium]